MYNKIWDKMSEKDRMYMTYISRKDPITTGELLELSGSKKMSFRSIVNDYLIKESYI